MVGIFLHPRCLVMETGIFICILMSEAQVSFFLLCVCEDICQYDINSSPLNSLGYARWRFRNRHKSFQYLHLKTHLGSFDGTVPLRVR